VNMECEHMRGEVYGIREGGLYGIREGGYVGMYGKQVFQGLGTSFSLRDNFKRKGIGDYGKDVSLISVKGNAPQNSTAYAGNERFKDAHSQ
jgi:hypothetical protein